MNNLEIYESTVRCSAGVRGPGIDPEIMRVALRRYRRESFQAVGLGMIGRRNQSPSGSDTAPHLSETTGAERGDMD